MDWKTLLFSPDGRIGRSSFWIAWLVLFGVNVILGWAPLIGWALCLLSFLAAFAIGFGFLVWVGVSNGQPGENRYGPAPSPATLA